MFHKNIPNNNKETIRFLAKNFAGTKKARNTILFFSIVIGIVAITMVFGISFGKIQAEEIRAIRENGIASSGRIEDGTEEQYTKLKQLDYIKRVGKSIFVGEATEVSENNAKTICDIVWADSESWNNFLRPAYTNVIGSYPQKKDEILLSERALKKLGISEPDQGMEINLDVYKGVFEHSKETFKLCGWYTDSGNELATGYISHDKINELNLEKGSRMWAWVISGISSTERLPSSPKGKVSRGRAIPFRLPYWATAALRPPASSTQQFHTPLQSTNTRFLPRRFVS